MNKSYEEWLKYYENATKEQVIEDMMLDIKEIERLNNIIDKAIEYIKSPKICIDIRKTDGTLDFVSTDELLNILNGGDEE